MRAPGRRGERNIEVDIVRRHPEHQASAQIQEDGEAYQRDGVSRVVSSGLAPSSAGEPPTFTKFPGSVKHFMSNVAAGASAAAAGAIASYIRISPNTCLRIIALYASSWFCSRCAAVSMRPCQTHGQLVIPWVRGHSARRYRSLGLQPVGRRSTLPLAETRENPRVEHQSG